MMRKEKNGEEKERWRKREERHDSGELDQPQGNSIEGVFEALWQNVDERCYRVSTFDIGPLEEMA